MSKIAHELKEHMPFTAVGALSGIIFMLLFRNLSHHTAHNLFYIFHPLHIVLSAIVTTSLYKFYQSKRGKCNIFTLILVGYIWSLGIATLSDSIIPFLGERLLNLPYAAPHIGFIDEWWLVNPAAFLGIVIGYFFPQTKFPHAGHVLISTWASLFHVIMAIGGAVSSIVYFFIFLFLFISVWVPCCLSDIVFPLLFVKKEKV